MTRPPPPGIGEPVHELPYKPGIGVIMGVGGFFGLCGVVLTSKALQDGQLESWGAAGCSWVFVAVAVAMWAMRLTSRQRVVLGTLGVVLPVGRPWSKVDEVVVPLSAIRELSIQDVGAQRLLRVHHTGGEVVINAGMLPEKSDLSLILTHLTHLTQPPPTPLGPLAERPVPAHVPLAPPEVSLPHSRYWVRQVLSLLGLLSFCGGPLYLTDLLKPELGQALAFAAAFSPLGVMLLGALAFSDRPSPGTRVVIGVGAVCAVGLAALALVALAAARTGLPDGGLIAFGSLVGLVFSGGYLWSCRAWWASEA